MLWSPAYCAAKAGVIGLTRQLALELGPYGITINCVSPVDTVTERMEELSSGGGTDWPESAEDMIARYKTYPLGRPSEAKEVADVILFLASNESKYVSGENIIIAGACYGHHAQSKFLKIEREKAAALREGGQS